MKFLRLDLRAFGHFTDRCLEFPANGANFHVVYGPNEAGKSTALTALTSLLYGIPTRTPLDFLHNYKALLLGATIVGEDGSALSFQRKKGNKLTLLDAQGESLSPSALAPFLGRVDQAFFEGMFGLDHRRLRLGGEEILSARGDVGESLFQSGSAIIGLHRVRERLDEEAKALFAPQASKPAINALLGALKDARMTQREAALKTDAWRQLEQETTEARQAQATITTEREQAQRERKRLERIRRVLPLLSKYQELCSELSKQSAVPDLPEQASAERRQAETSLIKAEADLEGCDKELAKLEIAGPEEGSPLPAARQRIRDLTDRRGAAIKWQSDLPRIRDRVAILNISIGQAILAAGRSVTPEEAQSILLPAPVIAAIKALDGKGQAIQARLEANETALRTANDEVERLERALEALPTAPDSAALRVLSDDIRSQGRLEDTLATEGRAIADLDAQYTAALAAMPLWQGDGQALASLPVPSEETLRRRAEEWKKLEDRQAACIRLECELQANLDRRSGELAILTAAGDVPTPESVAGARSRRNQGWRLIRRRYVEGAVVDAATESAFAKGRDLPEAYEEAVAEADSLADQRESEAHRIARFTEVTAQWTEDRRRLAAAQDQMAGLQAEWTALELVWRQDWQGTGISPLTPAEMLSWLAQRREVLNLAARRREAIANRDRAEQAIARCLGLLAEGLAGYGVTAAPASLTACLAMVSAAINRMDQARMERDGVVNRLADARNLRISATARLAEAEKAQAQWRLAWAEATAPLGDGAALEPVQVAAVLGVLEDLAVLVKERTETTRRIIDMEADDRAFAADVAAAIIELAPQLSGMAAVDAIKDLSEGLETASRHAERQTELARRRAALECGRSEADQRRLDAQAELERLRRQAGCDNIQEIEAVEALVRRHRQLVQEKGKVEDDIRAAADGRTVAGMAGEVAAEDIETLETRIQAHEDRLTECNNKAVEVGGRLSQLDARHTSLGTGVAAEAAQKAESVLAELQQRTEQYATLKLAAVLLRRSVEAYRARHQAPLLARAGDLFQRLTGGSFAGLATDFDDNDNPILLGRRPDNGAVPVDGMSEGSRDQLFLSLRLAAVEHFLNGHESIPFVADDLLIHFDDDRATAALEVLAELANRTQVLFFSHNEHIVELARRALGDRVGLHRL